MDTNPPDSQAQLDLNDILIAEFQYIAQTAFQANEDRARVSNFYFVTLAAAVAAIIGTKIEGTSTVGVYLGFSIMFAVLSAVGLITLLQLARLRTAWTESARAMNIIKQYYMERFQELQPEKAFAWNMNTIPPLNKQKSVAFLLSLSIMIVDAATISAATIYLSLTLGALPMDQAWLLIAFLTGAVYFIVQYVWYMNWLS